MNVRRLAAVSGGSGASVYRQRDDASLLSRGKEMFATRLVESGESGTACIAKSLVKLESSGHKYSEPHNNGIPQVERRSGGKPVCSKRALGSA